MKSLRVLEISLRADRSGGPRHLLSLLRRFPSHIETHICAPVNEDLSEELARHSAGFIPCPRRSFSLLVFIRLFFELRKRKIDVIHSHGRGAGIYSRLLGLISRTRVVHTFHAVHVADGLLGQLKDLMDRTLRSAADAYILVSKDELAAASQRRWLTAASLHEVIPNGVDIPPQSLRRSPSEPVVIGQIARKDSVKGWDILNRLLTSLQKTTDFRLVVAGLHPRDFQPEATLEELSKTLGVLSDPQELFKEIDLYLSTSRNEGLPLAVLEAMACGIPCLLSRVPGHIGLIDAGAAEGYELNKDAEFLDQIRTLLADPDRRSRLGEFGRNYVKQRHSADTMASLTAKLYERVALRDQTDATR